MKVAIGTDHNGYLIKQHIIKFLESKNIEVISYGNSNNPIDDYPEYAFLVSENIKNKEADLGILICGTGIGMSIAANKVKGIRCALVSNVNEAALSKEHNDANILALSSKNNINEVLRIVEVFINTKFGDEDRHRRRISLISKYENGEYNV
ncbi:MAG: ribose 5-phosphate isomerase B [Bacilli bacterium]|nr:ribose 5-phosphate isomerase B [Bacilli bacterium]